MGPAVIIIDYFRYYNVIMTQWVIVE